MEPNRETLRAFLAARTATALVPALMRDLEPLYRIAESGVHALAEPCRFNATNVAAAVASAVRRPVDGVRFFGPSQRLRAARCCLDGYDPHLSGGLFLARRADLGARIADRPLDKLVNAYWFSLGMQFTGVIEREHDAFLSRLEPDLAATVSYGPALAAFYLVAYASLDDRAEYMAMRGLVRLLPWTLPIGAPADGGGWLMLAAEDR